MIPNTKICFKCSRAQPLAEFYRHPQMADGHLNKCKACAKADVSQNYRARIDQYKAYDYRRNANPERHQYKLEQSREWCKNNRERRRESVNRWACANRHKTRAQLRARRAMVKGLLVKQNCQNCGRPDSHAHHEDYSKPLDVMWLCSTCHGALHAQKRRAAA